MKIIKRYLKGRSGTIKLKPNNEEDIWYLYKILQKGDTIKTRIFRKIKVNSGGEYGVNKVKRKAITLTLKVLEINFQSDDKGTSLTCKTMNLRENKVVMIGQIQNVEIFMFQEISICKEFWKKSDFEFLDESVDEAKGIDSMIILYDDGHAGFFFLKRNFTKFYGKICKSLPKKKKNMMDIYKNNVMKFDQKIWRYIYDTFDTESIKVIVLAGPGNAKDRFLNRLKQIDNFEKDLNYRKKIQESIKKFVKISTSTIHKSAVNEILKDPIAQKVLQDTKAIKEAQKLKEFFLTLENNSNKACYGEKEIYFALDKGAIKSLLITDGLLKSNNFTIREKFERLVKKCKRQGGEIFLFHEDHISGQKLKEITGIAAILTYEIDLGALINEDSETEEEEIEVKKVEEEKLPMPDGIELFVTSSEDEDD